MPTTSPGKRVLTLVASHVVLVTGASSGMGKDFALRLIAEGYVVYAAARQSERMCEIEASGGRLVTGSRRPRMT